MLEVYQTTPDKGVQTPLWHQQTFSCTWSHLSLSDPKTLMLNVCVRGKNDLKARQVISFSSLDVVELSLQIIKNSFQVLQKIFCYLISLHLGDLMWCHTHNQKQDEAPPKLDLVCQTKYINSESWNTRVDFTPPQKRIKDEPIMSRKSSAKTMGPLSMGFPDPLNTLPTGNNNKNVNYCENQLIWDKSVHSSHPRVNPHRACPPRPGFAGCPQWTHRRFSWHRSLKCLQIPANTAEKTKINPRGRSFELHKVTPECCFTWSPLSCSTNGFKSKVLAQNTTKPCF